jgi:hypothetical protein
MPNQKTQNPAESGEESRVSLAFLIVEDGSLRNR